VLLPSGIPEKYPIEEFSTNCSDQSLNKRIGNGNIRNRLDLIDANDPQVGKSTMESKWRTMIGAEMLQWAVSSHGAIEHSTNDAPSRGSHSMPKPMMRRVKTPITTITQWPRNTIDSHRNRSTV
jgi:hypothetical protein